MWGTLFSKTPDIPDVPLASPQHVLGRGPTCQTVLPADLCISNRHCTLTYDASAGQAFVQDSSTNGTFLNSQKVGKGNTRPLQSGDTLTFVLSNRHLSFVFKLTAAAPSPAAPGPSSSPISSSPPPHSREGPITRSRSQSAPSPMAAAFEQQYDVRETLGKGTFADVKRAVDRQTGEEFAVKVILKRRIGAPNTADNDEKLWREVEILQKLQHPSIVAVRKVIDSPEHLYLVLDLARGGELFYLIQRRGHLAEAEARTVFRQVGDAVRYLHALGIAHRDIKPENILLAELDDISHVMLTDFGLAQIFEGRSLMRTMCGTPLYVAPEVLDKSRRQNSAGYTPMVDLWSLGVILYILLSGRPPFPRKRDAQGRPTKRLDYTVPLDLAFHPWSSISAPAKELIAGLLKSDPQERMSITATLAHPWLQDVATNNSASGVTNPTASPGLPSGPPAKRSRPAADPSG